MGYMVIDFDTFDSETFKKVMVDKGVYLLYMTLRRFIIRGEMSDIYSKEAYSSYYQKNILVCAIGTTRLSELTGIDRKTIRKGIKILEDAGFIEIEKLKSHIREGAVKRHFVYILGYKKLVKTKQGQEVIEEFFLMDDKVKLENG